MERQDPLRTGAIFKVLPQSMKAPPKIVKFDTSKASVPNSTTKALVTSVHDPVREAFNHIYRATPTPKMFVGRAVGGFNSSNNSPYWSTNLAQQIPLTSIDSPILTTSDEVNSHLNYQPILVPLITTSTASVPPEVDLEPCNGGGKSAPVSAEALIPRVSRPDISKTVSPNASQAVRIQPHLKERIAAPQSKSSRSVSASSSLSRGGSRSRSSGSDSLLLLVSGTTRSVSSTTSSSSLSVNTRDPAPTIISTGRSTSSVGGARGRRAEETQRTSLVQPTPPKKDSGISQKSVQQAVKVNKVAGIHENTETVSKSNTADKFQVTRNTSAATSVPKATVTPKVNPVSGSKRTRLVVDESEGSETDHFPTEKAHAATKSHKRKLEKSGRTDKTGNVMDTDETEDVEEEEVATVTRSGRKSVPKKVIPLAEDIIQGEKQQLKANRGRRAVSVTASSTSRPRSATTTSRKSLGTHANAPTSTSSSTAPTRKTPKSSSWSTSEVMALYAAQGRTDISAPDFWELVAEGVAEVGFDRTAEECQQQWFVAVEEAAARKRSKEEKMKNNKPRESIVQAAINKKDGTEEKEPPAPTKAKRMGKNALKKMAQESSKATRDDDIFDSGAMRAYWTEDSGMDVADFLPSEEDLLEDLQLFDPTIAAPSDSSSSQTRRAGNYIVPKESNGGNKDTLDTEIEFGSAHVHKLNYRPPSKHFSLKSSATSGEVTRHNGKHGKLSATLINKQVHAAVQGAKKTARGGKYDPEESGSSESGSEELESDEENEE